MNSFLQLVAILEPSLSLLLIWVLKAKCCASSTQHLVLYLILSFQTRPRLVNFPSARSNRRCIFWAICLMTQFLSLCRRLFGTQDLTYSAYHASMSFSRPRTSGKRSRLPLLTDTNFAAISVTIPFELDIILLFDKLTPAAEAISANRGAMEPDASCWGTTLIGSGLRLPFRPSWVRDQSVRRW